MPNSFRVTDLRICVFKPQTFVSTVLFVRFGHFDAVNSIAGKNSCYSIFFLNFFHQFHRTPLSLFYSLPLFRFFAPVFFHLLCCAPFFPLNSNPTIFSVIKLCLTKEFWLFFPSVFLKLTSSPKTNQYVVTLYI